MGRWVAVGYPAQPGMPDTSQNRGTRLDSWKAISAYLGRDESTVRRWEREAGLPVRRVPGSRRSSVFANSAELDAWLNMSAPGAGETPVLTPPDPVQAARPAVGRAPLWLMVVALSVAGATFAVWRLTARKAISSAELTSTGVVARNPSGAEAWRFPFSAGERWVGLDARTTPVDLLESPSPGVLAGVALWVRARDEGVRGGELLRLSISGDVQHRFTFNDTVRFGERDYTSPWGLTDFRVNNSGGPAWVAVAGHHYVWWPSVLTVLDEKWHRLGTFVNAGWIERISWLSQDRLVVAGFNEALNGGVVALVDPAHLDGQVPLPEALSKFRCATCGTDVPVRYVVMPRSEVNLAGASRFNRAMLEVKGDRVIARTIEAEMKTGDGADVLYEFDRRLNLVNAAFSEQYWNVHHQLELEHKLNHSRDQCADRDGPRIIRVWEPATGWRDVLLR